jgi:WD40 repeat protein
MNANDPAAHPLSLPGPAGTTTTLTLSMDKRWLVTSGKGQHTRLWDLNAGNPATQPYDLGDLKGWAFRLVTSPDGRWVAATIDLGPEGKERNLVVRVWKREGTGRQFQPIPLDSIKRSVLAITPQSRWLVTYNRKQEEIELWDLVAAKTNFAGPIVLDTKSKLPGPATPVVHYNGRWLVVLPLAERERPGESAVRPRDVSPLVFDLECEDPRAKAPARLLDWKRYWMGTFSLDGRKLIATDFSGDGLVWDLTSSDPIRPKRLEATKSPPKPSSTGIIGLRTPETGGFTRLESATSLDGHWFIGAGPKGGARLWDLTADVPLGKGVDLPHGDAADANAPPISCAAFSDDGNWLATLKGDEVCLWNLKEKPASRAGLVRGQKGEFSKVAVTDRWLALVGYDGTVRLSDFMAKNPRLETFLPPELNKRPRGDLVIGPNGRWAIIADTDSFDLWDNDDAHLIDLARRTAGRKLKPSEWELHFPGKSYPPTFP